MRVVDREPEAHLIELLQLIEENPQGWQVIAFQFSKLLEHYRSEYQIKIATNLMNDLLGDRDGAIYLCEDSTIYVMVQNFPRQLADKMIFQLRYLFMDDPLSYTAEGDENPAFSTNYAMDSQWQEFMSLCKRRLVMRVRAAQNSSIPRAAAAVAAGEPPPPPREKKEVLRAFTASNLAAIEADMKDVDLSTTIRRQPICAALPETPVRSVFDEMYININHLRQSMGIEVDLLSNRWLFKYLTQILDERMLDTIQRNPIRYLSTPISLNLNIPTLLSSRFAEFDAAIKPSAKVSIVIELQIADVFADMSAFLLAKDTVQKLGYRVCLDGVSELSLPQIDRQRLGFDLVKLIWNSDSERDIKSAKNQKLAEAVRQCGNNRVILTRCDNKQAVEYGQALGITLFQGRYLDGLVNPKAVVKN
jgi:EAL domain-containing protein (putative c-di-GMP-specific phosphodiesterase class I)